MKRNIIVGLMFLLLLSIGFGASQGTYVPFKVTFSNEAPSDIKIIGYKCLDSQCSNVDTNSPIEIIKEEGATNCVDYYNNNDANGLESCLDSYKSNDGTISVRNGEAFFLTKVYNSNFGYIFYVFARGDTYVPYLYYLGPASCNYEICVAADYLREIRLNKITEARAEVGQLNIKNLNDDRLPIQVEAPISVDNTVCSAYSLTMPNAWKPTPPVGYSDFSSKIDVVLKIFNNSNNQLLYQDSVTANIEADLCAPITQVFTINVPAGYENTEARFRVETRVMDEQVINGLTDVTEIIATIYPQDLSSSCWINAYDFTLSNEPSKDLTSSLAEYIQGESLYAIFDAEAYYSNNLVPINFNYAVYVDDNLVLMGSNSGDGYDGTRHTYVLNLSKISSIKNLQEGEHVIKIGFSPATTESCVSLPVVVSQNLYVHSVPKVTLNLHVSGEDSSEVTYDGVLELLETTDNFVEEPSLRLEGNDIDGSIEIPNLYRGRYRLEISAEGYQNYVNEILINNDMDYNVVLHRGNNPPNIDLPTEFRAYYQDGIAINLRDYILDTETSFDDLNIEYTIDNPNINVVRNNDVLYITSSSANEGTLTVRVSDSGGLSSSDSTHIILTDNNPPSVSFSVTPNSGIVPLNVMFNIQTSDPENDNLECTINFGDGSNEVTNSCDDLNRITKTYQNIGTYNAVLRVSDGHNLVERRVLINALGNNQLTQNYPPVLSVHNINGYVGVEVNEQFTGTDPDGDSLTFSDDCDLFDIDAHTGVVRFTPTVNDVGTHTCNVNLSDGSHMVSEPITITISSNSPPVINNFNVVTSINSVPADVTFTWSITNEPQDEQLACELRLNNSAENYYQTLSVDCDAGNYVIQNYNKPGETIATLVVSDTDNSVQESKVFTLSNNQPSTLEVYSHIFGVPDKKTITIATASDPDNDDLTFSDDCDLFDIDAHTGLIEFVPTNNDLGSHICNIYVNDGYHTVSQEVNVSIITETDASTLLPRANITNTNLNYYEGENINIDASNSEDPNGLNIVRYLLVTPDNIYLSNTPNFDISFNSNGEKDLSLVVYNSNHYNSLAYDFKVIITSSFTESRVQLLVDENLVPGEFTFRIVTNNETINRRLVKVKPTFKIGDSEAQLINSPYLTTNFINRNSNEESVYTFRINTNDFTMNIPKGEFINFNVYLYDEFGTMLKLTKQVKFAYPEKPEVMTSITGNTEDIVSTMTSAISDMRTGFNNLEFKLRNNEDVAKKVEVTISSPLINLNYHKRVSLNPNSEKEINIPIYVSRVGRYPVRITLYNGQNKITQYSYININR